MSLLNNPFDPAREAALVTGAGNGIGRAIAQALVGEGVRTVFADANRETAISLNPLHAMRCWPTRNPPSGR
jgi:NAD(P)-dependent dehydrogenase (short-subunit alcohol dehydrogenase family)